MNARRMTKCMMWVLALVTGLTACDRKENSAMGPNGETMVRIGSVSPLTGPQAHLGKDNANGARLAIDEINATGITLGGKVSQPAVVVAAVDDAGGAPAFVLWRIGPA